MPVEVRQWLEQLGLGEYAEAFDENAIEPEHLGELNHETLKEIGVQPVGHRLTILKAAAALEETALQPSKDPAAEPAHSPASEAEHRQLSVMFCDLVDSTALSERLDLEKYRELLGAYHDATRKAIGSYEGYIARYMGDGLLVYFGYPTAHEDDAERAVRAGLAAVDAVGAIRIPDVELQVRVGIATGRVLAGDIVGEGASEEHSVLGETPNLAARLQGLAAPNKVMISETTMRLVEGRFELESLKPRKVKGLSAPVRVFQVGAIRSTSRFDAATSRGLSVFVGRQSELQLLLERWAQARNGEGQVVTLSGEAGIGKSRMLRQLRERVEEQAHATLRYQCSPYGTKTAFMPFIEQLQHNAGFSAEDTVDRKLDKLEALLSPNVDDVSTSVALIAALLSLPADRYPPLSMTPPRQKQETVAALVAQLEGLARRKPVLILVEDLHWIDPSTLETFESVVERTQALPVLMVMTHRPEFEPSWGAFGHVTHHSLNRLNRTDGQALATQVAGGRALPETVMAQILEHTDGVPLFIEELTKTILEGDLLRVDNGRFVLDGPLAPLAIPSTLQDSLMARLDRLAPVKEVAQAASCIGREFTTSLLATVLKRTSLDRDLQQLVESGLVFRRRSGKGESYMFKHALVQDTAYESLLASKRRELHARIAEALEALPDTEPAVLARHFSAAGFAEQAATNFLAAGQRALSVSALAEAAGECELGLHEIQALPPSRSRDRQELDMRMALGAARIASFGWPHSSVTAAYEPAFELAEKLEDRRTQGHVLWGLCVHYWTRAEFEPTHQWLSKLEAAADASKDDELAVVRDMTAGCQYFWEAEYDRAYRYTAHIRKTYDEDKHAFIVGYTNHDPLCFSLHWAGSLLQWIIGYPDLALELADEAHALARRIGHPFNFAFALTAGSEGLLMRGDTERVLQCCDEVQEIIDDESLGDFAQHVLVNNWRGRAHTRMGDFEKGYRLTNLATTRWREAEGHICTALFRGGEALALGGLRRHREALEVIEATINHCRRTGDRFMEPEVLRIKAELVRSAGESAEDEAETILNESLRLARGHKAKSWELRTATSLANLKHAQGRRFEALDTLAPVYDWFTEGYDTTDLREAKAQLQELS